MVPSKLSSQAGLTLIELVLVVTLTEIMVAIVAPLVTQPVTSYIDVSRRTTLVDAAESAIRRMQRDLRHALPNSIRITGGTALESLYTVVSNIAIANLFILFAFKNPHF